MSETTETGPTPRVPPEPASTSTLAVFAFWNPIVAVLIALAGVLGIKVGLLQPLAGFTLFVAGAVLGGIVSVLVGAVALFLTHRRSDPVGQRRSRLGAVGGLILLAIVWLAARPGAGLPPINDITTDPEDPPTFHREGGVARHAGRDMAYPGEEFAVQQREAYPEIVTLHTAASPAEATRRALDTANALGWEITFHDEASGRIEAWQRSDLFEFVDYVAIRVRPSPDGGSVVDLRSASRDGRGDLGTNARRIQAFLEAYPR